LAPPTSLGLKNIKSEVPCAASRSSILPRTAMKVKIGVLRLEPGKKDFYRGETMVFLMRGNKSDY